VSAQKGQAFKGGCGHFFAHFLLTTTRVIAKKPVS